MKIAFYLQNVNVKQTDFTTIFDGNPGVGGTQYSLMCIVSLLSERENGIEVTLFVDKMIELPYKVNCLVVENLKNAVEKAEIEGAKYLIVDSKVFEPKLLDIKGGLKYILWCNNFEGYYNSKLYAKSDKVAKLLSVGKEESDLYIDDLDIMNKTDYIYNGISISAIEQSRKEYKVWHERANNVVFVGHLSRIKGFMFLARAWKKVIAKVPDAQLYIIGSTDFYGTSSLKDSVYFEQALTYLSIVDREGHTKIMDSVHLLGVMGQEKNEILKQCKVGVPKPGGGCETFNYVAVEMQAMGCLIATQKSCGFVDTVYSNGILYTSPKVLAKSIVELLRRKGNDDNEMMNFIVEHFSLDKVIREWEHFLLDIDKKIPHDYCLRPNNYRMKQIKNHLQKMKQNFPFLRIIPPIEGLLSKKDRFIAKINEKYYG